MELKKMIELIASGDLEAADLSDENNKALFMNHLDELKIALREGWLRTLTAMEKKTITEELGRMIDVLNQPPNRR